MRTTALVLALALAGCGGDEAPTADDHVDVIYPDADGDGIMDHHESGWGDDLDGGGVDEAEATGTEGAVPEEEPAYLTDDFDGDGTPNYQDTDSDDDGIPDSEEAGDADLFTLPMDSDLDLMPNFLDLDSDDNCIHDQVEGNSDLDGDGWGDYRDLDNDGDGISDRYEIGESCEMPDHDGDGIPDFEDQDSDGDGIADLWEGGTSQFNSEPNDTDGDGTPDYLDDDSDGDGLSDQEEAGGGEIWEPPRDTDGDGVGDFADTDSDGDGIDDADELAMGLDHLSDDTDGDGFSDGAELLTGSDPLDPNSGIDGIYVVVPERTDVDELFQFTLSVQKGDVAFLLDTTGSMGSLVSAMSGEFASIVSSISSTIPDAGYAVATFDDYVGVFSYSDPWFGAIYTGDSASGDRPFILRQQVTDNTSQVQSTLNSIPLHYGGDAPESAGEALYQILSGNGYDQNCNGSFDSSSDVRPFMSSAGDAFGGGGGQSYNASTSGGGTLGGAGFRPNAMPIVIYATDAEMRGLPGGATLGPNGCSQDARDSHILAAANQLGARLIGVCVNGCPSRNQMLGTAAATNSYADLDNDGAVDDPLVFDWSGSNANFRNTITGAVDDLVQSVAFDEITLEVVGDDQGFVVDIQPPIQYVSGAVVGQQIDFTLTFRGADAASAEDELHALTLNVYGDGTVLLDTLDIFVLVPGVEI